MKLNVVILLLLVNSLPGFTQNKDYTKIICSDKKKQIHETYYFTGQKIVGFVVALDSNAYTYKNNRLVKISQFKKNTKNQYHLHATASYSYAESEYPEEVIYSDNLDDRRTKCTHDDVNFNKFNLLDDDFCFLLSVLGHDKTEYSFKNLKSGSYTLDLGITMLDHFTSFRNGSTLKKLDLKVKDKLVREIKVVLAGLGNEGVYEYRKTFVYNSDGTIKTVITKDLTANKTDEVLQYEYFYPTSY